MTFIGAGTPYGEGSIMHRFMLESGACASWNISTRGAIKELVQSVPGVEDCVVRTDSAGYFSITVSNELSEEDHRALLIDVIKKLETKEFHTGSASEPVERMRSLAA